MKIWFLSKKIIRNSAVAVLMVVLAAAVIQGYAKWGAHPVQPVTADTEEGAVFQGTTGGKNVALTINVDWGEEYLPDILKLLKEAETPVTFFVTGSWAEKNPELLKQMAQAGHSIQSHGYHHDHYNQMSVDKEVEELAKAEKIISDITGKKCVAFASPYGEFDDCVVEAAQKAGYHLIMWTIDSIDWQKPAPETITERILGKLQNDAIILMHPTEPTLQALPAILSGIKEKGYTCMTIEDLLQLGAQTHTAPATNSAQPAETGKE